MSVADDRGAAPQPETYDEIVTLRLRPVDKLRIEALRVDLEARLPAEINITRSDILRAALASAVASLPAGVRDQVASKYVLLDEPTPPPEARKGGRTGRPRRARTKVVPKPKAPAT